MTSPARSGLDRPRIAVPVLRRDADRIQVGLEPPEALVLTGPGRAMLVKALDGSRTRVALLGDASVFGLTRAEVDLTLRALQQAGLLEGTGGTTAPRPAVVRLVGAGPVGHHLARLLAATGTVRLYLHDLRPATPAAVRTRAEALQSCLEETWAGCSTAISHWSKPESATVDLTVLVADGPENDRLVADQLLRRDEPHLLVGSLGHAVRVGPLVLPGSTACLHCTDLVRRDRDPHWPALVPQLTRLRLDPPGLLTSWAASVAATQVMAFLSGTVPETAGATLECGFGDLAMRLRTWPTHPGCGCSWYSPTEWEP